MAWIHFLTLTFIEITITVQFTQDASVTEQSRDLLHGVGVHEDLLEHAKQFDKQGIIKVNDHVYVGFGYGIANCIFVLAPDGLIIVDSMESALNAQQVFKDFKNSVADIPVKAIIYTHFHGDHNEGTQAFIKDPDHPPDIWAHKTFAEEIETNSIIGPILFKRGIRQFGFLLPQEKPWYVSNGIGPSGFNFFHNSDREVLTSGIIWPNRLVEEDLLEVNIAGLPVTMFNMPGETRDQLGVWFPTLKTFMCGDNLYKTFPNIYTIRGTTERDPMKWVSSLDMIRDIKPDYLVPSHTEPISGKDNIYDIVTKYRDGIQYLHDQTIRLINKGYSREDASQMLRLDPALEDFGYLKPHYGTLEWSSKAVHNQYFGWFNGRPEELSPLSPIQESHRVAKLAGGLRILINRAHKMLDASDYQWALELSTHALRVSSSLHEKREATSVRRAALKGLAEQQTSPNGRYYYLSTILDDSDLVKMDSPKFSHFAMHLPMMKLLRQLSLWFKAEISDCGSINSKIYINFTDSEMYKVHIRNGIVDVTEVHDITDKNLEYNILLGPEKTWREYIAQTINREQLLKISCQENYCNKNVMKNTLICFEFDTSRVE